MRGRKPKPTVLHELEGTFHSTRHQRDRAAEPIATGELAEPPPDLTEAQEAIWRYVIEHAPRGVLKSIDREMLYIWVEAADRHNTARMMQAMLDRDAKLKLLVNGPKGIMASPYNKILTHTALLMIRAAQELGFSPAARPRLKVTAPPPTEQTPMQRLRVIVGGKNAR